MAYLNLMILLSRYIFGGFALVFIIVIFSGMKPFIGYNLGSTSSKNSLLYICIFFFHLGASSILIGKADASLRGEMLQNSIFFFILFTSMTVVLRLLKQQEQLLLWNIIFFLLDVSYIMLERLAHELARKQLGWMVLALMLALVLPPLCKRLMKPKYKYLYLGILVSMMLLPFIFGKATNGAINWVNIGPVAFQPSEIGKIALIFFLAAQFYKFEQNKHQWRTLYISGAGVGVALVALVLQRDLGGALLYYLTFLMMVLVGTHKIWLPLIGVGVGGVGSLFGYFLFSHVRVRVNNWIDPWQDISGSGYQVVQGLFAMGTWGWFGSGLTKGIPEKIPYATTDYIFAAISEEFGNLFAIIVILCYLGIVIQSLKIVLKQTDAFFALVITGIAVLLGLQTFIILGGVLKVIPLTGVTLPFVSYGGSSLLISIGMVGLLSYFSYYKHQKITKKEEERYEKRK